MINGGSNKDKLNEKRIAPHRFGEAYSSSVSSDSLLNVMCVIC